MPMNQSKRGEVSKDEYRKYTLISPIQAPFSHFGRLFDTNSAKKRTIIVEIPAFFVHLDIGGYIGA